MKNLLPLLAASILIVEISAPDLTAQIPPEKQQVEAAVLAAPEGRREGAKVYGYDQQGNWTVLREGTNTLICIADDPEIKNFHVACYYEALEPFMKRGRELRKRGLTRKEVDKKRRAEIESGEIPLPRKAMTLYSLSGESDAYDYETGTLRKAQPLTVVYVPFETEESTGMTTQPSGSNAPWLMEAGTPWAHIMIPGPSIGEDAKGQAN